MKKPFKPSKAMQNHAAQVCKEIAESFDEVHAVAKTMAHEISKKIKAGDVEITDVTDELKVRAEFEFPWHGGVVNVMCCGDINDARAIVSIKNCEGACADVLNVAEMHFQNAYELDYLSLIFIKSAGLALLWHIRGILAWRKLPKRLGGVK